MLHIHSKVFSLVRTLSLWCFALEFRLYQLYEIRDPGKNGGLQQGVWNSELCAWKCDDVRLLISFAVHLLPFPLTHFMCECFFPLVEVPATVVCTAGPCTILFSLEWAEHASGVCGSAHHHWHCRGSRWCMVRLIQCDKFECMLFFFFSFTATAFIACLLIIPVCHIFLNSKSLPIYLSIYLIYIYIICLSCPRIPSSTFNLVSVKRTYNLRAGSLDEARAWVATLRSLQVVHSFVWSFFSLSYLFLRPLPGPHSFCFWGKVPNAVQECIVFIMSCYSRLAFSFAFFSLPLSLTLF